MRLVFTILFFGYLQANATNYYVSNVGSDAAGGTTTGTSWLTLSKVSSYSLLTGFLPGDSILLKRSDTWNDSLRIYNSGSVGNPIVIGAYGAGVKPVISGFANLTMASIGSNLYTGTLVSNVGYQNTILVNGEFKAKGRYPQSTFLSTTSAGPTSIVSEQALPADYTGAEIVVKTNNWITDVCKITSQVGNTLTFTPALTYSMTNRNYFFIQNLPSLCDAEGEYAYDQTTKLFTVYSATTPVIKYSKIDTLLQVINKNYITVTGIHFEGSNKSAARFDTCNYVSILNSKFNFNGNTAIDLRESDYASINYDSVLNSLNNGIAPRRNCDFMNVNYNYVKNTSKINGLGIGSEGAGFGIFAYGRNATIRNNRVDSTGYVPVYWQGPYAFLYQNHITNFGFNKDDGGGIYTYVGDGSAGFDSGSIVRSNHIINGIGVNYYSPGLYLDQNTNHTRYDSNFVWGGKKSVVLFYYPRHVKFTNNTIINTSTGRGFYLSIGGSPFRDTITNNIFYSTDTLQPAFSLYTSTNPTIVEDSNYVLRPLKDSGKYYKEENLSYYAKAGWVASTGYGVNDSGTPSGVTTATPLVLYNPTSSDSVRALDGLYKDAKGQMYNNEIVLHPFESAILFKADHEISVPTYNKTFGNKIFGNLIFF